MSLLKGRFRLGRELGSGGMARVFLGADEMLGRSVAVKILKPGFAGSEIFDRFRREGRTFARLSHPNVVQVYDAGEAELDEQEVSYIVMEYVPGGDLKRLVDEKDTLEEEQLARIGAGAAAALAHAHGRGVIHRDVKPHNILLDGNGTPKLTDFGIARALDATRATRTGTYLGTALYSSPEQLRGEKATPKSDVYSLGVTLYQAATGEPPFTGSPLELAGQHATSVPVPPRENGATVGAATETLILDCLAKDSDDRPTAEDVYSRLSEIRRASGREDARAAPPASEPATATRTRPGPAARSGNRRARGVLALLALLVVVTLGGVALAVPSLTGGGAGPPQAAKEQNNRSPTDGRKSPRQEAGQQKARQNSPRQANVRPAAIRQQESASKQIIQSSQGQARSPDGLTAAAAAATVKEMYTSAAARNYDASYDLLSEQFKQSTAPSEGYWAGTFSTLESIKFVQGPTATINGDTATVTGTTIAVHTDHTERNTGTWTLVDEGGEWKVNDVSVQIGRI